MCLWKIKKMHHFRREGLFGVPKWNRWAADEVVNTNDTKRRFQFP